MTTYYAPNGDKRNSSREYVAVLMVVNKETIKGENGGITTTLKHTAKSFHMTWEAAEKALAKALKLSNTSPDADYYIVATSTEAPVDNGLDTPDKEDGEPLISKLSGYDLYVVNKYGKTTTNGLDKTDPVKSVKQSIPDQFKRVPENIVHMIRHANTQKAKDMWHRIAVRHYGKKSVTEALSK
jgi:hypothetical protein